MSILAVKENDFQKLKNCTSEVKDINLRSKENELQEVKNVDRNYIENNKSKYSKREYSFGVNGLGTPATRAGSIENLIFKGFVERDKKNLIATHKGISLVTIVADNFKSAETTAKWEMELSEIARENLQRKNF